MNPETELQQRITGLRYLQLPKDRKQIQKLKVPYHYMSNTIIPPKLEGCDAEESHSWTCSEQQN